MYRFFSFNVTDLFLSHTFLSFFQNTTNILLREKRIYIYELLYNGKYERRHVRIKTKLVGWVHKMWMFDAGQGWFILWSYKKEYIWCWALKMKWVKIRLCLCFKIELSCCCCCYEKRKKRYASVHTKRWILKFGFHHFQFMEILFNLQCACFSWMCGNKMAIVQSAMV